MRSLSKLIGASLMLAAASVSFPAHAGVHWSVNVGVPVYARPHPVYVTAREYIAPQQVYVSESTPYVVTGQASATPQPTYVEPVIVYRDPQGIVFEGEARPAATATIVSRVEYESYAPAEVLPVVEFGSRGYWGHHRYYRPAFHDRRH